MLKQLKIIRFKSIQETDLQFGRLNFFIGTNASGKSNLFDALKVLQGIGYGFRIDEILNGKEKTSTSMVWDEIRGGSDGAVYFQKDDNTDNTNFTDSNKTFELEATFEIDKEIFEYIIKINPFKGFVIYEELKISGNFIYATAKGSNRTPIQKVNIYSGKEGRPPVHEFTKDRPVLHQIHLQPPDAFPIERRNQVNSFINLLSDQQKLDLVPSVLREYSKLQSAERIGEKGENFAALVKTIISDEKSKKVFLKWLHRLTPAEVEDIYLFKTPLKEVLFGIKDKNREIPATLLSDGTLRFAALTAALFQNTPPKMMLIEEIENGIHPTRLKILVELLTVRSEKSFSQLFLTTHSPILLAWLDSKYYQNTFLCSRTEFGNSVINPIDQAVNFKEIIKKQPINDLFAEGWLEGAL